MDPDQDVADETDVPPWHSIVTVQLSREPNMQKAEYAPWSVVSEESFRLHLVGTLAAGLVWGLLHPVAAIDAMNERAAALMEDLPMMRRSGLDLGDGFTVPDAEASFSNAEGLVRVFEAQWGSIPVAPAQLSAEPRIAARLVQGGPPFTTLLRDVARSGVRQEMPRPVTSSRDETPRPGAALLGYSFSAMGGKFHCLACIERGGWKQNQRALAVVRTFDRPSGSVVTRALRVVMAGRFGSRDYAVDDPDVPSEIVLDAEFVAARNRLLLIPSRPIEIGPKHLRCSACGGDFSR